MMDTSPAAESFRGLLLRHRGRTGLTQRELAARLGADRRTVQDWEAGLKYPTSDRLQGLIAVLLEAGGLTSGREAHDAHALWAAVLRDAPRMHTPFDPTWFASLVAGRGAPQPAPGPHLMAAGPEAGDHLEDWGEAPDTREFVGRTDELSTLRRWVVDDGCRVVVVLGMGGIGKTSLIARLAHDVAASFERVYWRSLRDAPPATDWLGGVIGFLSDQQLAPPANESERLAVLLRLLRERRCLLVLDNVEAVFEPGQGQGRYREGLAGYGRLLRAVGEARHQSCVVLTSREAPPELAELMNDAVRTFRLGGLEVDDTAALLATKHLDGTGQDWAELNARFGGNGLALKVVGERIRELFDGEIGAFLEEAGATSVFGGIRRLLLEQVERSSAVEQQVLRILAVEREPLALTRLLAALGSRVGRGEVLAAVEALHRRSLVERAEMPGPAAFTLQSVVLEYVTERLVEAVAEEIEDGRPVLLVAQPLIQAQVKDYVRQTQERLIGAPILQQLGAPGGADGRLLSLLDLWRGQPSEQQGFGPGNVVNLLRLERGDLRGLDLSRLVIRQAYLAEVEAQNASLAGAHLVETVLAEAFDFPGSVALSADGTVLASGSQTGEVWVWRVQDRAPLLVVQGHSGAVWGVALSADGQLLASGSSDGSVRLWNITTGESVAVLHGHTGTIRSVALSADGRLLASGGTDGTVRLWQTSSGGVDSPWRGVATLEGHTGGVWRLALSGNGDLLASVGTDGTVRLWETGTARPTPTLEGQVGRVTSVALSAAGDLLACGETDGKLRLWETTTGRHVATLEAHTGEVWGVALAGDGKLLASGGTDGTARLWETNTGRPLATCLVGRVWNLTLSADGELLATGGSDATIRVWETSTGQAVATLQGQTGTIRSVATSADGQLVASGGEDGMVRLWDGAAGRLLDTLKGNAGGVLAVSMSADGQLVASGAGDGTVHLWEVSTGRRLAVLRGHTGGVRGVALSAAGHLLASGGVDGTVRVWEMASPSATLLGHTGEVRAVALSADGRLLATGGADRTVRLWTTTTGEPLSILQGHAGEVWGLALSADGDLLASGSADGTVRLWETRTGQPIATLDEDNSSGVLGVALSADSQRTLVAIGGADGTVRVSEPGSARPAMTLGSHTGGVPGVALSAGGRLLVTGSYDGTLKLWETPTGRCLHTLRAERRYERLDISGLSGITAVQRTALLGLGAVEPQAAAGAPVSPPRASAAESDGA